VTEDDKKLVERLSQYRISVWETTDADNTLRKEAAARIESLSAEVERLGKLLDYGTDTDAYRTLRKRTEASEARVRALGEALRYARPIVEKWGSLQAGTTETVHSYLAPIDAALGASNG